MDLVWQTLPYLITGLSFLFFLALFTHLRKKRRPNSEPGQLFTGRVSSKIEKLFDFLSGIG
ncbi:MAG TPA: hypothetical protein VMM38_13975 [Aridibacter sp.]|nr:hypothetical protein [Aridibacter sp.]